MLGFHTPIGSAFSPDMYLCCDLLCIQKKESFYLNMFNHQNNNNKDIFLSQHVFFLLSIFSKQAFFMHEGISQIPCIHCNRNAYNSRNSNKADSLNAKEHSHCIREAQSGLRGILGSKIPDLFWSTLGNFRQN